MKRHKKIVQYIVLAAVVLIGGYAIGKTLVGASPVLNPGSVPPAFKLVDLDGAVHDSQAYAGKPLVINFWGTFCPPCRKEMPALQNAYERWSERGVNLIGINLSEDRLSVQNFVDQVGAKFPILLDQNRQTEKQFGLKQYPTTFFIRPDGKINTILIGGPLTEAQIDREIGKLIPEK